MTGVFFSGSLSTLLVETGLSLKLELLSYLDKLLRDL